MEIGRRWSLVPVAPEESTLERVLVPARGRAQASEAFPAVLERATEWGFKVVFPVREWHGVPVVRRVVESPGPDWVVGPDLAKRECLACPGRSAPAELELELPADWETDPAMGIFPARSLPVWDWSLMEADRRQAPVQANRLLEADRRQAPVRANRLLEADRRQAPVRANRLLEADRRQAPVWANRLLEADRRQAPVQANRLLEADRRQAPVREMNHRVTDQVLEEQEVPAALALGADHLQARVQEMEMGADRLQAPVPD
jgi:hypothetical protein